MPRTSPSARIGSWFAWLYSIMAFFVGLATTIQVALVLLKNAYEQGTANAAIARSVLEFSAPILAAFGVRVPIDQLWPWISVLAVVLTFVPVLLFIVPLVFAKVNQARRLV